jgi:uncharacterized protein (TIGR02996 family)
MTTIDFLQEILENLDDDTPRLIFADWLEEHGDDLGEFIRIQCEVATLTKPASKNYRMYAYSEGEPYYAPQQAVRDGMDLPHLKNLLSRQLALLMAHCAQWALPLGPGVTGAIFRRGFVEGISTRAANYLRQAPAWYRFTPIRQLHLTGMGEPLGDLLASPFLLHLQTLELGYAEAPLLDQEAFLLAACPNLVNLRHLNLGFSRIREEGCQALLVSPYLKNLQSLEVPYDLSETLHAAVAARFGAKFP